MKANKGEWSEFYTFIKILEDKQLPAADKNLEVILDKFFIFQKIIRNEVNQESITFDITTNDIIILDNKNNLIKSIKEGEIKGKSIKIFEKIKNSKGTTFQITEAEELMKLLLCKQLKASSSKKSDIDGIIYDRLSNKEELLGFSVKSMIGSASTLLNAGKTTNFIYEVKNLDQDLIDYINKISSKSKIQDRIKEITKNGGNFIFDSVANETFEINLRKIDTIFPIILSEMLLNFYFGKTSKITSLVNLLEENTVLKSYRLTNSDYIFKMKNLLISAALGMVPSKERDGFTKAHGGYIIVKSDGEVVCYHLYNREEFLTYLYENTKFESSSSGKHQYGKLYVKEGKVYFNLNLQIRFLK